MRKSYRPKLIKFFEEILCGARYKVGFFRAERRINLSPPCICPLIIEYLEFGKLWRHPKTLEFPWAVAVGRVVYVVWMGDGHVRA